MARDVRFQRQSYASPHLGGTKTVAFDHPDLRMTLVVSRHGFLLGELDLMRDERTRLGMRVRVHRMCDFSVLTKTEHLD